MTRKAYIGLQMRLADLRSRLSEAATPAQQARIRRLEALITNAWVDAVPPDDGVAEPGMVVTVRHHVNSRTETFLLGLRGAEDADIEVYSPNSPLGTALVGARPGEQRRYRAADTTPQSVTLLRATPYGRQSPKHVPAPIDSPAA